MTTKDLSILRSNFFGSTLSRITKELENLGDHDKDWRKLYTYGNEQFLEKITKKHEDHLKKIAALIHAFDDAGAKVAKVKADQILEKKARKYLNYLILKGKYDWVGDDLVNQFWRKCMGEEIEVSKLELMKFTCAEDERAVSNQEVYRRMDRDGVSAANFEELLSFRAANLEMPLNSPIIATGMRGIFFAQIVKNNKGCGIGLFRTSGLISSDYRYLVHRK